MNNKLKFLITVSLILMVVFISIFWGNTFAQADIPGKALSQIDQAPVRTVSVSGVGEVQTQPDLAVIRLGVQTENTSPQTALDENNNQTQSLMETLDRAGITSENIQTHSFQIIPNYEYNNEEETRILLGYQVLNIVEVRTNDIGALGALLGQVVDAGANTIQEIRFEVSNTAGLADQAREMAVRDAQRKAEQLVNLTAATLGPVLEIRESSNMSEPVTRPANLEASSQAVPVQPGTQNVRITVQITWQVFTNGPSSAAVVISPTQGKTGSDVTVNASGFPPDTNVELGVGHWGSEYDVVQTGQTDHQGALSAQITIPEYANPGEEWVIVVAVDKLDGLKVTSNRFLVK